MDEIGRTRLRFFLILLVAIVAIHAIVLYFVIPKRSVKTASPQVSTEVGSQFSGGNASAASPASKTAAPTASPDWASDFFGRFSLENFETLCRTGATEFGIGRAPSRLRFRKISDNPKFGAPLDFGKTRHGNLPAKEVAGSDGAVSGIVVDMDSRRVLWEKNSEKPVRIASMTKMMTLLLVMEELERRTDLDLESPVKISRTVLSVPRTGVIWLDPRETLPLSDLLKAACIRSANDAATMLAEFMAGSVPAFVAKMNSRAAELKLTAAEFINPCGLPDRSGKKECVASATDMVLLGERLLEYPQLMEYFLIKQTFIRNGKSELTNTNKLINPHWPGVDGLKTGYYSAAGSCLTFSALRDGRRVIGCVTGFKSARDRDRFCRKLIDWAYKQK